MRFERAGRNLDAARELPDEDPERARRLNLVREDVGLVLAEYPDFFRAQRLQQDLLLAEDPALARERYLPEPLPRDAAALTIAARMYLPDELDNARALLEEALEIDSRFAWAHYGLGFVHFLQNRLEEADESLGDALDDDPVFGEALELRAEVQEDLGHLDRAADTYDRLLEMFPEGLQSSRFQYRKAHLWVQTDDPDDAEQAEALLLEVLSGLPRPTVGEWRELERDALLDLGVSRAVQEKPEEALATFDQVLELDPKLLQAHYNRGWVLEMQLHRYAQALRAYQRFQSLAEASDGPRSIDQLLDEVFFVAVNIQRLKDKIAAADAADPGGDS